jgi:hypothetical protein
MSAMLIGTMFHITGVIFDYYDHTTISVYMDLIGLCVLIRYIYTVR